MTCEVTVRIDDRIEVLLGEKGRYVVDENRCDAMSNIVAQSSRPLERRGYIRIIDSMDLDIGIARQ
jgi:hypothetical protein